MLRKIVESIRDFVHHIFVDIPAIRRIEAKRARHRRYVAKLLHSSYSARNAKREKLQPYDTLAIITDDGVYVEYMNGKIVGRGYVGAMGQGVGKDSKKTSSVGLCRDSVHESVEGVGAGVVTSRGIGPCNID